MRSLLKKATIGISLLVLFSPSAYADCGISQLIGGTIGFGIVDNWMGQSFKACETGVITQVTFNANFTSSNTTFGLQAGSQATSPTHTQTITTVAGGAYEVVNIVPSFPVTSGSTYSWGIKRVDGSKGMSLQNTSTSVYPDGLMFVCLSSGCGGVAGGVDVQFTVTIMSTVAIEKATWGAIKLLYTD